MRAGKGLVLVTGPTGSGKTTTLGALLQQRLDTSPEHLITLEDPIELALRASRGLVRQRELGRDFMDYPSAIRAALREDPDIVLVGEVRDQSTVSAAVQLADTGHLVFGTLHTRNATATVSRLINMVPSGERSALQTALGDVLVCILSQGLARRADGTRQLVSEVLMGTAAVRSNIAEGRTREIANNIAQGRRDGHRPWVGNLLELVRSSALTRQEALAMCEGDEVADFNEQYAGGSR
jgi:twitching motility protein PilT